MANPYKIGSYWYFNYYIKQPDGSYQQKKKGGYITINEAKRAKRLAEARVTFDFHLKDERVKCKDFFSMWLEDIKRPDITYNSYTSYRNCVNNYIIPFFGNKLLTDITRRIVKSLYRDVCDKSPHIAKLCKPVILGAFDYAVEEKLAYINPATDVTLPESPQKHKPKALKPDQIETLIRASKKTRIYIEILLSVILGLRKAELSGIKYSDVDFSARTLTIQRALGRKNKDPEESMRKNLVVTKQEKQLKTYTSGRVIVLPAFILTELRKKREEYEANREKYGDKFYDGDFICCSKKGQPHCTSYYQEPFKTLLSTAGLPDIRWHDLRHTAASFLLNKKVNLKAISSLLGHAGEIMTGERYLDTSDTEIAAMEVMDDYIATIDETCESVFTKKPVVKKDVPKVDETELREKMDQALASMDDIYAVFVA